MKNSVTAFYNTCSAIVTLQTCSRTQPNDLCSKSAWRIIAHLRNWDENTAIFFYIYE